MTTLTAALRLVRPGGLVVVSEPPNVPAARWTPLPPALAPLPSPDHRVAVFHVKHEGA
jgi:hypothetical protein